MAMEHQLMGTIILTMRHILQVKPVRTHPRKGRAKRLQIRMKPPNLLPPRFRNSNWTRPARKIKKLKLVREIHFGLEFGGV